MPSLYLIPKPAGDTHAGLVPPRTLETLQNLTIYIVEKARTVRRFLSSLDIDVHSLEITEDNKHKKPDIEAILKKCIQTGTDIGLMSESGAPGIADPGAETVRKAYDLGFTVVPLVGPSFIFMALMASGMNGQHFEFVGYLPKEPAQREEEIRRLEQASRTQRKSIVFIETPFRVQWVFESILRVYNESTRLCLARDVTLSTEMITTESVGTWKKRRMTFRNNEQIVFVLEADNR